MTQKPALRAVFLLLTVLFAFTATGCNAAHTRKTANGVNLNKEYDAKTMTSVNGATVSIGNNESVYVWPEYGFGLTLPSYMETLLSGGTYYGTTDDPYSLVFTYMPQALIATAEATDFSSMTETEYYDFWDAFTRNVFYHCAILSSLQMMGRLQICIHLIPARLHLRKYLGRLVMTLITSSLMMIFHLIPLTSRNWQS
jgi:hypothetical protein